ncbi:MAG: helix-turn-helix domain-containing protein [Janthinobacterium lividum]
MINTLSNRFLRGTYTFPYIREMNISTRLKQAMSDRRVSSQSALARSSGVPQPTINRILTGKSANPDSHTLARLAVALSVSSEWLLTGRGDKPVGFPQPVVPAISGENWPFKVPRLRFEALPDSEKDRIDAFLTDTIRRWEAFAKTKKLVS